MQRELMFTCRALRTIGGLDGADHIVALKKAECLSLLREQFPHFVGRVEIWAIHDLDCAQPDESLSKLSGK